MPEKSDQNEGTPFRIGFALEITSLAPFKIGGVLEVLGPRIDKLPFSLHELFRFLLSQPVVSSVSPNQGPHGGGTPVTITGSGFTGATGVCFGSWCVEIPSNTSDTIINVVSPAATSTGTVDVIVGNSAGLKSAKCAGDKFTYT